MPKALIVVIERKVIAVGCRVNIDDYTADSVGLIIINLYLEKPHAFIRLLRLRRCCIFLRL